MTVEAFFRREGDAFHPTDRARGPWDPESLHGRVISGLIAYAIEQRYGDPSFQVARLTVDMFRVAPHAPVEVTTRAVREGNRIRVVDGTLTADGVEIARGSAVMLRRADQPEGNVWRPDDWDVPHPDTLHAPRREGTPPPGRGPAWETRPIEGNGFGGTQQKRTWIRENAEFIAGEAQSPLVRIAQAADFANPLANSGDAGLQFVNADVTLYIHRLPAGEWIGFEVTSHTSAEGIAVGACALYDLQGRLGSSTVCAVANRRAG